MQKLLFMFFAVGCVYNIQAEESQVVELESTTEQVEANETPVMKKNKRTFRPNVACPTHVNCKAFLKFTAMDKKNKDQLRMQKELHAKRTN
ncbi:MAG TPA: hypothetical protein VKU36_02290 [Candidatus Babeliales bacterium]|nr:hypothetical protein [Candidatus Babeliales bacterium]